MNTRTCGKVFTITILIILGLEVGIRILWPRYGDNPFFPRIRDNRAFVPDAEIILQMKPSAQMQYKRNPLDGGQVITWHTNSDGIRVTKGGTAEAADILVYGDSNIFGVFSEYQDTFVGQLEKNLSRKRKISVVNSGLIGAGPDQMLLKLKRELRKYSPRLVVFTIYADNDFGDLVRNGFFRVAEDGKIELDQSHVRIDSHLYSVPGMRSDSLLARFYHASAITQYVYFFTKRHSRHIDTVDYFLAENANQYVSHQSHKRYSHVMDDYDADLALLPDLPSSRLKEKLMTEVLSQLAQLGAEKRVKILVLILPSSRDLTKNLSPNYTDFISYPSYRPQNLTKMTQEICQKTGLEYVNLYDVFAASNPASLYFQDHDDHWNDRGQALAAKIVAEKIQASRMLYSR